MTIQSKGKSYVCNKQMRRLFFVGLFLFSLWLCLSLLYVSVIISLFFFILCIWLVFFVDVLEVNRKRQIGPKVNNKMWMVCYVKRLSERVQKQQQQQQHKPFRFCVEWTKETAKRKQ